MAFTLSNLQQPVTRNLVETFSTLPGDKVLLVDSSLLKLLDRVANMSLLRQVGVNKVMKLADLPPKGDFPRMVYMIPADFESTMKVVKHCEVDQVNQVADRRRLVIFVPQVTADVLHLLESRGHTGHHLFTAGAFLGWSIVDEDVVSLNLPSLFPDFYFYGDSTWPHFMGRQLGHLLELASDSPLAPMGCRVHAFGPAARVVASGLRLHCVRSGLVKGLKLPRLSSMAAKRVSSSASSLDSIASSSASLAGVPAPPPLVIIFSRDYDYVSPLLVPMTFEALLHEVLGINMGVVEVPPSGSGQPTKQLLNSSKMHYYKFARNTHISRLPTMLRHWQMQLQKTHTALETELSAPPAKSSGLSPVATGDVGGVVAGLRQISTQLGPLLAKKRELGFLLQCLTIIMDKMTKCERVEDLRTAQMLLLQSGSGDSLALPSSDPPASSSSSTPSSLDPDGEMADEGVAAVPAFSANVPSPGGCGSAADGLEHMPIRLAIEWLSTHHADHLIDGIRLLSLASVTHEGLGRDLFPVIRQAILHAVGQSALPMLYALSSLKLLSPRHSTDGDETSPAATARLRISTRHRSQYNRLHQLLRLSHSEQASRRFDRPPVSPTYVYGGQHCPVVVRLAEAVWFHSLTDLPQMGKPDSSGKGDQTGGVGEIVPRQQLIKALQCLSASESEADVPRVRSAGAAASLGALNLGDPLIAASGFHNESLLTSRRLTAPLPHPFPLVAAGQPVVLVFPGGCTYGEIAALRFVANRRHWKLLVVTSALLTSRDLLQQAGQVACQHKASD